MALVLSPILYALVPFSDHWRIEALYNEPTSRPFYINYDDVPSEYPTLDEAFTVVTSLNDYLDAKCDPWRDDCLQILITEFATTPLAPLDDHPELPHFVHRDSHGVWVMRSTDDRPWLATDDQEWTGDDYPF